MNIKRICIGIIILILSLMTLIGCADSSIDKATPATEPPAAEATARPTPAPIAMEPGGVSEDGRDIYHVSSVDELLAAIGSERAIFLAPGVYDLTDAAGYGGEGGEGWYWADTYDGYELVINGLSGLSIIGGSEKTEILTQPRYADVLAFEDCEDISIEKLTLGHSPEPGLCAGGVLWFDGCSDVYISGSRLYGCGIIGLQSYNCKQIYMVDSEIFDCSISAVHASACSDIMLLNCRIYDNCKDYDYSMLFQVDTSMGFALVNCEIYENAGKSFISSSYSQQVSVLGCEVRDNDFTESIFNAAGYGVLVDKSSFDANGQCLVYDSMPPVDPEGKTLSDFAIESMQRQDAMYSGPVEAAPVQLEETVNAEGIREVWVDTVDEFLAAIASDTVIILEGELYDLSTAADYGAYGTENYYWQDMHDGPGLVINGVQNLSIESKVDSTIAAIPRYADVLKFINCEDITLKGFTAGHTQEPGFCSGGVLKFENCWDIDIDGCSLYGCGIMGIDAYYCSELAVKNTEIYECSNGAIALYTVMDASFENMDIHDCAAPEITLHDCMDVVYEGDKLNYGAFRVFNGKAAEYSREQ